MKFYNNRFYANTKRATVNSAEALVPLIIDLLHPKSVVDVGCAAGTWLAVYRRLGVPDIFGVDTGYAKTDMMEIPADLFLAQDLENPFRLSRTFDLVTSLEVAEHLPEKSAGDFVDSLVRLGPVILFSAAIPFQGGSHHLNEQWPEYWGERFAARGYVPVDCLRVKLWDNPAVAWWYAQNLILYVKRDHLETQPHLKRLMSACDQPAALIHPRRYMATADLASVPFRRLVRALPAAFLNGARNIFKDRSVQW